MVVAVSCFLAVRGIRLCLTIGSLRIRSHWQMPCVRLGLKLYRDITTCGLSIQEEATTGNGQWFFKRIPDSALSCEQLKKQSQPQHDRHKISLEVTSTGDRRYLTSSRRCPSPLPSMAPTVFTHTRRPKAAKKKEGEFEVSLK